MLLTNLLLYVLSFVLIWFGSGFIISGTSRFSKRLRISPFAFSFVFLGLLTSIPEFSVGLQAIADHNAEIFVGNLLGGIVVLFLFVIPILAVFGNGITLTHELTNNKLLASLGVIILPSYFVIDNTVTNFEGAVLVFVYLLLIFFIERKRGIFDRHNVLLLNIRAYSYKDILKIFLGIAIVFASSNIIVEKTLYFAEVFNISAFYISLLVVALGTNIPELSIAIRTVISGKKDIAMGDYIGSATVNTLFFGVFTILHNGEVLTISNFSITFLFIAISLALFYTFFRTKQYISRKNGLCLIGVYVLFIIVELLK